MLEVSQGMLACLCGIDNTTTVTTAGMRCTGTNCETMEFVCEYYYKGQEPGKVLQHRQ